MTLLYVLIAHQIYIHSTYTPIDNVITAALGILLIQIFNLRLDVTAQTSSAL